MSIEAWTTLLVLLGCLGALVLTRWPIDAVLIGGVSLLMLLRVITPAQALGGMASPGMITVGALYVVVNGLERAGLVGQVAQRVLPAPKRLWIAKLRLMFPVAILSSVLNNTPVVAMLVPAVSEWCKRHGISAAQLMIPLSYAAIVGGLCSLIGTSTNIVVNGMMLEMSGSPELQMFELAWIGVPCALVTVAYVVLFGPRLLPTRRGSAERFADARQYIVEMRIEADSPIVGKTIEGAGLRHLSGVYLVEIGREGRLLTAVAPRERLMAGDRLVFAGDVAAVVDLQRIRGLRPAATQVFQRDAERSERCLVEVVVSANFSGHKQTVRSLEFRSRYGAAIIAVSRQGEHVRGRIGDVILRPGDTLLLETDPDFQKRQQYSRDFLIVSGVEHSQPPLHHKRFIAGSIFAGMVIAVTAGLLTMLEASLVAGGLLILTRCTTVHAARQSVDWQVLLVIAASVGLGTAVQESGAGPAVAEWLANTVARTPTLALGAMFAVTALLTAAISNIAAALFVFPIAVATAARLGVDFKPFAVCLMVAASASFATPIGYQTNLMVYGPGDYRFLDFVRIGLPLTVIIGIVTVLVVPLVWPFHPA